MNYYSRSRLLFSPPCGEVFSTKIKTRSREKATLLYRTEKLSGKKRNLRVSHGVRAVRENCKDFGLENDFI